MLYRTCRADGLQISGIGDLVHPSQSYNLAARLQAAQGCSRPTVLRVLESGGHSFHLWDEDANAGILAERPTRAPVTDRAPVANLHERIWSVVRRIPRGKVATYGAVARAMDLRDARRVGWALAALPDGSDVPWHRVVNARGRISARGGGDGGRGAERVQRAALEAEGVAFQGDGSIDLEAWGWEAGSSDEGRGPAP